MNMRNSRRFIKQPIINILKDSVVSTISLPDGFNSLPVFDYIFSSVFIKMTGCLEQKMKLICWDMASEDLAYRRKLLANEDNLGECSSYEAKNKILKALCKQLLLLSETKEFKVLQTSYLVDIKEEMMSIFLNSTFNNLFPKAFSEWSLISDSWIKQKKDYTLILQNNGGISCALFGEDDWGKSLKNQIRIAYNNMIIFRNTIAHNTKSPLKELPALATMQHDDFIYENYFIRFMILILTDKTFVSLFDNYLESL